MRRLSALLGIVVWLTVAVAAALAASMAQAQPGPILVVYAGQGSGPVAQQDFIGDPNLGGNTVRVAAGTTVVWSLQSDDIHTVTFPAGASPPDVIIPQPEDPGGPPMLNPQIFLPTLPSGPWDGTTFVSAELSKDLREVRVTFAQPGRYNYLCLYHPGMAGAVEVVPPGASGITTQQSVDAQAAVMDALRQTQAATIYAARDRASRVGGGRGTDLWFIRAGTALRGGGLDIQAFLPAEVTIAQGDTVAWYVDNVQPHTVTFRPTSDSTQTAELFRLQLPDGTVLPSPRAGEPLASEVVAAFADPETAPRLVFGPGAQRTTSSIYDGRSLHTSGFFGEHPRVAVPMEKVWALTFNTVGSFQYTCLVHEELGMKGVVHVEPR